MVKLVTSILSIPKQGTQLSSRKEHNVRKGMILCTAYYDRGSVPRRPVENFEAQTTQHVKSAVHKIIIWCPQLLMSISTNTAIYMYPMWGIWIASQTDATNRVACTCFDLFSDKIHATFCLNINIKKASLALFPSQPLPHPPAHENKATKARRARHVLCCDNQKKTITTTFTTAVAKTITATFTINDRILSQVHAADTRPHPPPAPQRIQSRTKPSQSKRHPRCPISKQSHSRAGAPPASTWSVTNAPSACSHTNKTRSSRKVLPLPKGPPRDRSSEGVRQTAAGFQFQVFPKKDRRSPRRRSSCAPEPWEINVKIDINTDICCQVVQQTCGWRL